MTISVTQLNNYIRGLFDIDGVLNNVTVCGEITNLKKSRDGWYFSLKDEQAAINCFCYDSAFSSDTGVVIVAEGQINYYSKTGSVSLFVRRMTSTKNTGAAYLRFVELKEKLKLEGLFDEERKKSVPHSCINIGVVTSETGAVIHDITNVALRRQPFTNIFLYPVKVQGEGADVEIAAGIKYFDGTNVDAIIVGRGGGSNEDLSAFNSELVVRAVANSSKPVVSAVGHGIDYTLCDFAADRRAVTPSEAAEFVTIDSVAAKRHVVTALSRISNHIASNLKIDCDKVIYDIEKIGFVTEKGFDNVGKRVCGHILDCQLTVERSLENSQRELDKNLTKIDSLNPLNVLKRGYGYASNAKGVIKSVNDVEPNSLITLTLCDGKIHAIVKDKEHK